jgi:hypothetical protein
MHVAYEEFEKVSFYLLDCVVGFICCWDWDCGPNQMIQSENQPQGNEVK